MKKLICILLALLLLSSAFTACHSIKLFDTDNEKENINEDEEFDTASPGKAFNNDSVLFNNYDSILDTYLTLIEFVWVSYNHTISPSKKGETAEDQLNSDNTLEKLEENKIKFFSNSKNNTEFDWCSKIYNSIQEYAPRSNTDEITFKNQYGYSIYDLNRDGINELILLKQDYSILAVFSIYNGVPILLQSFVPRAQGWIDENGQIYVNSSGGAMCSVISLYKIDGPSCVLLSEFGHNMELYYKITYEDRIPSEISAAEFNNVFDGKFLSPEECKEQTKNNTNMKFIPIYPQ